MIDLILAVLSIITSLIIFYFAFKIINSTKGSRLFQISAILLFVLSVLTAYYSALSINILTTNNIISTIILIALNNVLFKLWLTTYNQDKRTHYPIFINVSLILSFVITLVAQQLNYVSPIIMVVANYNVVNLVLLLIILGLFISHRNHNKTREATLSTIVYSGLTLSISGLVMTDSYFRSIYIFITSILSLLLAIIYWNLARKSSYY